MGDALADGATFRESTMHWRQPGRLTACRMSASTPWIPCGSTNAIAAGSQDIESGYSPYEAALDRFVVLPSPPSSAGTRCIREADRGVRQRLVPLTLDDEGDADAPSCAPVLASRRKGRTCDLGCLELHADEERGARLCPQRSRARRQRRWRSRSSAAPRCDRGPRTALRPGECASARLNNGPPSWRAVDRDSEIFDQPERIVDRRMRVSRSHRVADAEELKSSVLVVNSRLRSAGDQIVIINRAKVR